MEDIYSTKTAAMTLCHELCKARQKACLDMLMTVRPGRGRRLSGRAAAACAGRLAVGGLRGEQLFCCSLPPPSSPLTHRASLPAAPCPFPARSTWWAC